MPYVGFRFRCSPTPDTLPSAYANVRDMLIDEGYDDQPMRTKAEVRSTLRDFKIKAEEIERRYRNLLAELDDADDETSN